MKHHSVCQLILPKELGVDSVHRPALWKILMHYGIPTKVISIIHMLDKDFLDLRHRTVRRLLNLNRDTTKMPSPTVAFYSLPRLANENHRQSGGISWTFQQSLEDIHFADEIALLP